jgi:SGNH domain (fused to AT3 domains)
LKRFDRGKHHQCAKFNSDVINYAKSLQVKTIVLTARFPAQIECTRYDNGEGGVELGDLAVIDLTSQEVSQCDDEKRRERVLYAYEASIRTLAKSFNIVLVYPIPEAGWDVPTYGFKRLFLNGRNEDISTSYSRYKYRTRDVTRLFDKLDAEFSNVHVARVDKALCSETTGRCINANDKGVYYYDDDHLSNAGARLVAPIIAEAVSATNAGT